MSENRIKELMEHSQVTSPYYRKLFEGSSGGVEFSDFPVSTLERVKEITHGDHSLFLGANKNGGICYSSSGSTGLAKVSRFDRKEWQINSQLIASTHWLNGSIREDDIVGNLATTGHASFMAVHDALNYIEGRVTEISIGGDKSFAEIDEFLATFEINVLTGVFATFLSLSVWYLRSGRKNERVHSILAGGELLFPSQKEVIKRAFPNAAINSFVYGSTDSGIIGFNFKKDQENLFRVYDTACVFEILDPVTMEPVTQDNKPGMVVVTNLLRWGAPVIRYANGDYAEWVSIENEHPAFQLVEKKFPEMEFKDFKLSANDLTNLFKLVGLKVGLLRAQYRLYGDHEAPNVELLVACFGEGLDVQEQTKFIWNGLKDINPSLEILWEESSPRFVIKIVSTDYFSDQNRKRAMYIRDER